MTSEKEQVELGAKIIAKLDDVPISKDQLARILGIDNRSATKYLKGLDVWFRYRNGHFYRLGEVLPHVIAAQKGKAGNALERKNEALARKTELEIEILEGTLVPVDGVLEDQNELLEGIASIIRASDLEDDRKADIFGAIRDHGRAWGESR